MFKKVVCTVLSFIIDKLEAKYLDFVIDTQLNLWYMSECGAYPLEDEDYERLEQDEQYRKYVRIEKVRSSLYSLRDRFMEHVEIPEDADDEFPF